MLFVAPQCFRFHCVYGIHDMRFFKFDRPQTCEGGDLERRIEQNGLNPYSANVKKLVSS